MSEIELYCLEFDSNKHEASRLPEKTAARLVNKETTLLALIESLDEFFNHDDAPIRIKTFAYLCQVLEFLPKNFLSRDARDRLSTFFLSRIEDGAQGLGYHARGILALESMAPFSRETFQKLLNTLLDSTTPLIQTKSQSDRFDVLLLFDRVFSKYRHFLHQLHESSNDLVPRLIACFEGEKDPRNLMVIFSILSVPMVEWDVTSTAQELFEAVFDYFPITFRPPPNDPYGITAQQLKDRLRECLASNAAFAPYAFPALMERLDSTSINRDSLQAISACVSRYGGPTVNFYSITLWDAVKFEILSAQEEDLAKEALTVLRRIAQVLASSPHEGPLEKYLKPLSKECNEHLEDTPTKQSSASGNIIGHVARTSQEACAFMIRAVAPCILSLYKSSDSVPKSKGLFEVLNELVVSNATTFGRWRKEGLDTALPSTTRAVTNSLENFSGQILETLLHAVTTSPINEVSYRSIALETLKNFAMINRILDDESITKIIQAAVDIVIREPSYGREEIKAFSLDVLLSTARQKPQLVIDRAIPALMAGLPDSDYNSETAFVPVLEALAKLSSEQQLFGTIIIRLKSRFYAALRSGGSDKYVLSLLGAMLYAFANGAIELSDPAVFGSYYQDIVMPFLKDVVASGPENFPISPAVNSPVILDAVARICAVILRPQIWVAQAEVCRNTWILFRHQDVRRAPPFEITDSPRMTVSTHILACLQREALPHPDLSELILALVQYSLSAVVSDSASNAVNAQISLIVNKFLPTANTSEIVRVSMEAAQSNTTTSQMVSRSFRIAFAILRGLNLRADPTVAKILPRFFALLSDVEKGQMSAHGLSTLLAEDEFLVKSNHCRISPLHQQKFFYLAVPSLIDAFGDAASISPSEAPVKEATKGNCLIALSGVLSHLDYKLIQPELERVVPLLMQSLTLEEDAVKRESMRTLVSVVAEDPEVLQQHISTLITRLLVAATGVPEPIPATAVTGSKPSGARHSADLSTKTSKAKGTSTANDPRTRELALRVLESLISNMKSETLIPYQKQVVKRLAAALDDRRRVVRATAVRCRAAWVELDIGAQDEDD